MDFFRAQDVARRNTGRLVLLFALAVISLIIITNVLVVVTLSLASADAGSMHTLTDVEPGVFIAISVAVIAVVGFGSLYKMASLRGGGARVAESLGARLLVPGSGDIHEQRVLNIVEEMAIASSTPVPPVYVLDEDAINAFAAGFSPSDAVIGVTRGTMVKLSREELQGVIAHEFSHILHGDMRLNIRLIGLLHGILVLGLMGYYLMRTAGISRRGKNGNGIIFLGLGLIVIGAAGTFFGNLIKAAVSRQREFLADASAVQFTRSADGIAGALKRIGGDDIGSQLSNPGAREISHALFSQGVKTSFAALFATHPPLEQRIRRLQPQWDGKFDGQPAATITGKSPDGASGVARQRSDATLGVAALAALKRAGVPDSADLREASRIRERIALPFAKAAHEPHGARALIYFLLIDPQPVIDDSDRAAAQYDYLAGHADAGVYHELTKLIACRDQLAATDRLVLINMALPALHQLSLAQYRMFEKNMLAVVQLAPGSPLMTWVYHYLVLKQLRPVFGGSVASSGTRRLERCAKACQITLSVLAHLGHSGVGAGESAYNAAGYQLQGRVPALTAAGLVPLANLSRSTLQASLAELQQLTAGDKQAFLLAATACIQSDGRLTAAEQALFQTCAEILDCPTPALF